MSQEIDESIVKLVTTISSLPWIFRFFGGESLLRRVIHQEYQDTCINIERINNTITRLNTRLEAAGMSDPRYHELAAIRDGYQVPLNQWLEYQEFLNQLIKILDNHNVKLPRRLDFAFFNQLIQTQQLNQITEFSTTAPIK